MVLPFLTDRTAWVLTVESRSLLPCSSAYFLLCMRVREGKWLTGRIGRVQSEDLRDMVGALTIPRRSYGIDLTCKTDVWLFVECERPELAVPRV